MTVLNPPGGDLAISRLRRAWFLEEALEIKRTRDRCITALPDFARLYGQAPALADALFGWPESGIADLRPYPPTLLKWSPEELLAELLGAVDDEGKAPPFGVPSFTRRVTDGTRVWARNRAVLRDPTATRTALEALRICASIGYGVDGHGMNPGLLSRLSGPEVDGWGVFQEFAVGNVFLAQAMLNDPRGAMAPDRDHNPGRAWRRRRKDLQILKYYLMMIADPQDRLEEIQIHFPVLVRRAVEATTGDAATRFRSAPKKAITQRGRHRPERPLPRLLTDWRLLLRSPADGPPPAYDAVVPDPPEK